jgi:hypothetical protein
MVELREVPKPTNGSVSIVSKKVDAQQCVGERGEEKTTTME